jgi:hypothetical protein
MGLEMGLEMVQVQDLEKAQDPEKGQAEDLRIREQLEVSCWNPHQAVLTSG